MPNQAGPVMKALWMFALVLQPPRRRKSIVLSFGIVVSAMGCTQADRFYATGAGAPAPSFAPIVQEVMPAVVNVSAVQRMSKAALDREGTQAGPRRKSGCPERHPAIGSRGTAAPLPRRASP